MKTTTLTRKATITTWIAQLAAAAILGMTLPFKFGGAAESVALFEQLGAEPFGRYASGVMEAIAVVLLLVPRTAALGGLLAAGIMGGAVLSHLTILGIEVDGDGGTLFAMALVALVAGATTAFVRRAQLPVVGARFESAESTNGAGA